MSGTITALSFEQSNKFLQQGSPIVSEKFRDKAIAEINKENNFEIYSLNNEPRLIVFENSEHLLIKKPMEEKHLMGISESLKKGDDKAVANNALKMDFKEEDKERLEKCFKTDNFLKDVDKAANVIKNYDEIDKFF
jgi:hypothetical protein